MTPPLLLHGTAEGPVLSRAGRRFDGWALGWTGDPAPAVPGREVTAEAALAALAAARMLRGVPIGVIGPRVAGAEEAALAEEVGERLARAGLILLCGGKTGAMEAACRGARRAGGLAIGLLPDEEWAGANAHVTIPLATGIGPARNAILARAAAVLIAVGGSHGTISEMAFGVQFGRPVLALPPAPAVPGAIPCRDPEEAVGRACRHLLGLDDRPGGA